ncbi:hypothetical protein Barb6_01554 [Bacteroidales bacterium Barb6]|nr:hypothetical protein Barb6_01554 [Bacteroidales bacterium Barb6]
MAADDGGFADNDTRPVVNGEVFADVGTGVNINARL